MNAGAVSNMRDRNRPRPHLAHASLRRSVPAARAAPWGGRDDPGGCVVPNHALCGALPPPAQPVGIFLGSPGLCGLVSASGHQAIVGAWRLSAVRPSPLPHRNGRPFLSNPRPPALWAARDVQWPGRGLPLFPAGADIYFAIRHSGSWADGVSPPFSLDPPVLGGGFRPTCRRGIVTPRSPATARRANFLILCVALALMAGVFPRADRVAVALALRPGTEGVIHRHELRGAKATGNRT